jgi:hypothetical protein
MQPWMLAFKLLLAASCIIAQAAPLASPGRTVQGSLLGPGIAEHQGAGSDKDATSTSRFQLGRVSDSPALVSSSAGHQQWHLQEQAASTWQDIAESGGHQTARSLLASEQETDDSDGSDADGEKQQKAGSIKSGRTAVSKLYMLPWLLPPSQVKFPYNGLENNLRRLLRVGLAHDMVSTGL